MSAIWLIDFQKEVKGIMDMMMEKETIKIICLIWLEWLVIQKLARHWLLLRLVNDVHDF